MYTHSGLCVGRAMSKWQRSKNARVLQIHVSAAESVYVLVCVCVRENVYELVCC